MLGLSLFLGEGAGLERYGVAEKAGRFLCRASSSLAWKPHSLLLANPRLTTPPPPTSRGAAVTSEAAGVAASLCCFFLSLFLPPHNKACAVRPVPGNRISTSIRTRSRARARRAPEGREPARPARPPLAPAPAPHPQPQQQPPQSPKRPRPPQGGRSIWGGSKLAEPLGPPPPPDSSAAARGGPETRAGQGAPPSP